MEDLYHHYRGSAEYDGAAATITSWKPYRPQWARVLGAFGSPCVSAAYVGGDDGLSDIELEDEAPTIYIIGGDDDDIPCAQYSGGRTASTVNAALLHLFPPVPR